jgi:predicted kinase
MNTLEKAFLVGDAVVIDAGALWAADRGGRRDVARRDAAASLVPTRAWFLSLLRGRIRHRRGPRSNGLRTAARDVRPRGSWEPCGEPWLAIEPSPHTV